MAQRNRMVRGRTGCIILKIFVAEGYYDQETYYFFGRVQGVGFRYHAYYKARQLGLTGWVKNRYDGSYGNQKSILGKYIGWEH